MPTDAQFEHDDAALRRHREPSASEESSESVDHAPADRLTKLQQTYGNRWVARQIQRATNRPSGSAGPEGGPLEDDLANRIQQARPSGSALAPSQRAPAEQTLGADLSAVRVHNDNTSAVLNEQLGARAFTVGRDIFFGANTSPADSDVLVHESAHAVQQGMGEQAPVEVGAADTAQETAADSAARSTARLSEEEDDRTRK